MGWESPNSHEGTYTVVLFIFTYFYKLFMMQEDLSDTESKGINGSQMMEMQSTEPHKKVGPSQSFKKKVA
jgi:hypothetical protein